MSKSIADISIVSANYNNGPYLLDFVESLAQSEVLPRELIIIDDGSKDDSLEILKDIKCEFLKVLPLEHNVGFANALNEGIRISTGRYIMRIDPDDLVEPERIGRQFRYLEDHPEIDLLGSNVCYFNSENGKVVGASNFSVNTNEIVNKYGKGEHGLLHGTVMGKAQLFRNHPYIQNNVPAEDYDIFTRMILDGAVPANLAEKLTRVRIHMKSVSNGLPLSTIEKTYRLRDLHYGVRTPDITIRVNYLSMKNYRRYLFEINPIKRLCFLAACALWRPDKAFKKFVGLLASWVKYYNYVSTPRR